MATHDSRKGGAVLFTAHLRACRTRCETGLVFLSFMRPEERRTPRRVAGGRSSSPYLKAGVAVAENFDEMRRRNVRGGGVLGDRGGRAAAGDGPVPYWDVRRIGRRVCRG